MEEIFKNVNQWHEDNNDTYNMNVEQKITYYLKKYPSLCYDGLKRSPTSDEIKNVDKVKFVMKAIDYLITPSGKYQIYSYGGKHFVEELFSFHVSNGEFILAMLCKGYKMQWDGSHINSFFRGKYLLKDDEMLKVIAIINIINVMKQSIEFQNLK